jgi:hypothetical protein
MSRIFHSLLITHYSLLITFRVYPREPGRARLPVQDKLYCEALTGVADPVTT